MEKWYEKDYVDRRTWLLENVSRLHLTADEFLVLSMIDYMNETHQEISLDILAKRTGLGDDKTDAAAASLSRKGYLSIITKARSIAFKIDGVFREEDILPDEMPVLPVFEKEFGRPLTENEIHTLAQWQETYSEDALIDALRNASIYHKVSIPYIRKILEGKQK